MNPEAIIECVPNFSEGTDAAKVSQIVAAMQVEADPVQDPGGGSVDLAVDAEVRNRKQRSGGGPVRRHRGAR